MDGTCKKVKASILYYCSVGCIFKTDLVPRSVLKMKRGEGGGGRGEGKKGEEETRSGKIRIEASADWLFHNACKSSTRVFTFSKIRKTRLAIFEALNNQLFKNLWMRQTQLNSEHAIDGWMFLNLN